MHWRKFFSLLGLLVLLLTVLPVAAAQPPISDKIEARLLDRFATEGTADFMVVLAEKPDLSPAYTMGWEERGWFVYNALTEVAERSQARARAYLDSRGLTYEAFWIDNDIFVQAGDLQAANDLAGLPEVELVQVPAMYYITPEALGNPNATEWGIDDVSAPAFWAAFGLYGEGVRVANIDTGVDWDHPALVDKFRCPGDPSNPLCWADPSNDCGGSACDNHGHGTHTMGTMVGDDGGANQIGMAPGAVWGACAG